MDIQSRAREVLAANGARLAILFGSRVRGRATAESDVDVGVLADSPSALADIEVALQRALKKRVDVIDLATAPPLLRFEIARDGILLVERPPGLWPDFKARAMLDWWDWAPTARMIHRASAARLRDKVARGQA